MEKPITREESLTEFMIDKFSRMYYFEWDRFEKIQSGSQLQITLMMLAIVAFNFLFQNVDKIACVSIKEIFIISLLLAFLTILISGYLSVRVHYGYKYAYVSNPADILSYMKKYQTHYSKMKADTSAEQGLSCMAPKDDMMDLLLSQFGEAAAINSKNNNKKQAYLFQARWGVIASLFFLALCALIYFIPILLKKIT